MCFNGRNIIRCVLYIVWLIVPEFVLSHSLHQHLWPPFISYSSPQRIYSIIYRNGRLMAKAKKSTQMKWQKQETAKYKPISKGWILERHIRWGWEYWLKGVNLRPERQVQSWLLTLRRLVVHPSHRAWFCDAFRTNMGGVICVCVDEFLCRLM